jgi:hypothetical protein
MLFAIFAALGVFLRETCIEMMGSRKDAKYRKELINRFM